MECKPFLDYPDLQALLVQRGMLVPDSQRAQRKLSQVGYYRLSGFWYTCRKPDTANNKRFNEFLPNTSFDEVFKLYLFDKRLRFLLLDAIERIEVKLKALIAHELGQIDPMAYLKKDFINPKQLKDYRKFGRINNSWKNWLSRQQAELERSKESCILHYREKQILIPIWVAVEAWSFGTLSKYYELLKRSYQNKIIKKLELSHAAYFVRWLQAINTLRNRCAHHTRVWNQVEKNSLNLPSGNTKSALFFAEYGVFSEEQRKRVFVLGLIIGYLVKQIGPSSDWLTRFMQEIETTPNLPINFKKGLGQPVNR